MSLRLSEIFTSVQGEGMWLGVPSTFVRVSGCNLRCVWCDTPYASWNPEGPMVSVEDLVADVMSRRTKHVVITGGEPMLFDPVEELVFALHSEGYVLTIETAGTIFRDWPIDLMSISPKLSHSTPLNDPIWTKRHERNRLNIPVLTHLIERYPNTQLKFVVSANSEKDIAEIEALLELLPSIDPERVVLMAEGVDHETLLTTQKLLVMPCIERGWRLTPRYHVELFGNTKGT